MRKGLRFCFFVLLFATIAAFWADWMIRDDLLNEAVITNSTRNTNDSITEIPYHKDGIEAVYPMILSGGSQEEIERWNKLITADFERILQIYSFNPFPQPTPLLKSSVPTILKLGYVVKENSKQLISIFYTADFNSPYSAHPTDLVYTTNIDKIKNMRIMLKDYIRIDQKFVDYLRTWNFITYEEGNEELNNVIKDYMKNLSDEELLLGLKTADQIGSANLYNVYSYQTPEKLGISIEVPNYLGDHIELEQEKSKLRDYIKEEYKKEEYKNNSK